MRFAKITAIASHLPDSILTNDELAAIYPGWTAEKIKSKTGISERRIAADGETAGDLAVKAAEKLLDSYNIPRSSINFILLCTQSPDYFLPTTACIIQDQLGLSQSCGALDFNLGCSGYVYGLSLAKGLIETGAADRILLIMSETYSKFIHPLDKSVRTLFGDGAAATIVEAVDAATPCIGPFIFGSDGSGAGNLIVPIGGARGPLNGEVSETVEDGSGNFRTAKNLYMNGGEVMTFTLKMIPPLVRDLLVKANETIESIDLFTFHQANSFMLEQLRRKIGIKPEKFLIGMEMTGNTVSATIPLVLEPIMAEKTSPLRAMLVGFGVGYSWGACCVTL